MKFEYQISSDDFVAGQKLYFELSLGRKRYSDGIVWILIGTFFLVIAWSEHQLNWASFLLAGLGLWWLYAGLMRLALPSWYIRRSYRQTGLAGKTHRATVDEQGFEVEGEECAWRVRWPGAQLKGESEVMFIIYGANTIFMFGKKYLTTDQQTTLRALISTAAKA